MEEKMRCPYCGEEILETAKKCRYCGEWLEEKEEKPIEKRKISCPICGELVEEGTKACPYCHERIEDEGETDIDIHKEDTEEYYEEKLDDTSDDKSISFFNEYLFNPLFSLQESLTCKEFWISLLCIFAIMSLAIIAGKSIIGSYDFGTAEMSGYPLLGVIFFLVIVWLFNITAGRINDLGKSKAWLLLYLIPFGFVILWIMCSTGGTKKDRNVTFKLLDGFILLFYIALVIFFESYTPKRGASSPSLGTDSTAVDSNSIEVVDSSDYENASEGNSNNYQEDNSNMDQSNVSDDDDQNTFSSDEQSEATENDQEDNSSEN